MVIILRKEHVSGKHFNQHEMDLQQFWAVRQNPYKKTNQIQMRELVISQNIVTCPFGHLGNERNNVLDGVYNEDHPEWKSQSQDRKFIENMNIGDIIVIPFKGITGCIIARIVSDPIYCVDTGLFTSMLNGEIQISPDGDTPFRPVGRKIQIIHYDFVVENKSKLGRHALCHINPSILPK